MSRALPVWWKYLLAVAVTCALALVIARSGVAGETPVAAQAYVNEGANAVTTIDATWRDEARKRDVPVRVYAPDLNGKPSTTAGKFPVILFSHGLGGNRAGGKLWAKHWASHGYVVVALQHAGSDETLWKGLPRADVEGNMKSGVTLKNLGLRVGDVHFAIDEIIRRTAEGEPAFARADPKRLGMSGHSFGAQTTLAIAGQKSGILGGQSGLDMRVAAAIAFSPNARNKTNVARQFGDIRMPLFSITGTEDGSILGEATHYQDRIIPFDNMPAGDKYLAVFDGGDHMVFGGHELSRRRPETGRDREIQASVKAATLAFWNAHLKRDAAAGEWLTSSAFRAILQPNDVFKTK